MVRVGDDIQDMYTERGIDSAWGARGQMTRSADSNGGPGGGHTYGGEGTQEAAPPDSRSDSRGTVVCSSLGGSPIHIPPKAPVEI